MIIIEVVALFSLRIGLPLLVMASIGYLVDQWQAKQLNQHTMG